MKIRFNIPNDRGKLYDVIKFPAGEIQVRLTEAGLKLAMHPRVDAYEIVANPIPDVIELAQLNDAIRATIWIENTKIIHNTYLFLPYLPFARADRRFTKGDSAGFGTFMSLIKSMGFGSIWTFDAHNAKQARYYSIANMLPTTEPVDQIRPCIEDMGRKNLVLILPDKGASERYDLSKYRLPILIAEKKRDAATGMLSSFKIGAEIKKYNRALIIDDICDGGGTFIGLARTIRKKNPKIKLGLYVSHGIFSQGFKTLDLVIDNIYISDYSFIGKENKTFKPIGEKQ